MGFTVSEAVKKALKIRMSVAGPSGSGKTLGALRVAYGLCGNWKNVVVIDTNIDDALVYAGDESIGIGKFGHIPFQAPHSPKRFIEAINAAIDYGAQVIVIDSASDEWAGVGGMLEMHDQVRGFNTAANWAKVNPDHQAFIKALVEQKRAHIIATFRQKSKIAIDETEENGAKKSQVRRLGIESIARPGTEYDFLLAVELDRDTHKADIITKRGTMLPDMRPVELTEDLGKRLKAWAEKGSDEPAETRDENPQRVTAPTNGKPKVEQPAEPAPAPAEHKSAQASGKPATKKATDRPFMPDDLRKAFVQAVTAIENKGLQLGPDDYKIVENTLSHLLENGADQTKYLEDVTGIPYLEDMPEPHVIALLRLWKPTLTNGEWLPCEWAITEAKDILPAPAKG